MTGALHHRDRIGPSSGAPPLAPTRSGLDLLPVAPRAKVVAVLAFVTLAAVTPRRAVAALAVDLMVVTAVALLAGVGARRLVGRLAVALPFLAFAALVPLIGEGERVSAAGLPVSLSVPGLWSAWNIVAKTGCGIVATTLLVATTPVPRILAALARLRVPPPMLAIAGFMLRYLDLLSEELSRARTAMEARGYRGRWLGQARPLATSAGAVFVRSFERGERIHAAMLARGYTGSLPAGHDRAVGAGDWVRTVPLPLVAAIGLVFALLGPGR